MAALEIHYATDEVTAARLLKAVRPANRVGVDCEFRPHPDFVSDDWRMILEKGDEEQRKKLIESDDFKRVSFDTFRNQLTLWQIGIEKDGKHHALLFNVQRIGEQALGALLKPLLTDPDRIYIGQNLVVEYMQALHKFGFRLGGTRGHTLRDVMRREQVLYSGRMEEIPVYDKEGNATNLTTLVPMRVGLGPMRARRLGYDRRLALEEKEVLRLSFAYTDTEDGFTDEQQSYAGRDAIDPILIFDQQEAEFDAEQRGAELREVARWEDEVIPVIGDGQLRGMLVNQKRWRVLAAEAETKTKQYYDELQKICLPPEYRKLVGDLVDEVNLAHIKMIDPNSSKDILRAFHALKLKELRLPDPSDPSGRRFKTYTLDDTSNETLIDFRRAFMRRYGRSECPPIDLLISYREWEQRRKTFGYEWLRKYVNPVTERVHSSKNQYGAKSGRFSDSDPNLQQIPSRGEHAARYRGCFCARPGHKLITSDYSQIELRILAFASQDPVMLDLFRTGKDIHTKTCSEMLKLEYDYISLVKGDKSHPEHDNVVAKRTAAKTLNFGIAYGMGEKALSINTAEEDPAGFGLMQRCALRKDAVLSGDRCQECARCALQTWRDTYSVANDYLNKLAADGSAYLMAEDLAGGRRFFSRPDPEKIAAKLVREKGLGGEELRSAVLEELRSQEAALKNEAKNHPIQGLNARMLKICMRNIWQRIREYRAWIIHVVHDEVVVESPCSCGQLDRNECAEDCTTQVVAKIVQEEMEASAQKFLHGIPTPVEYAIALTWSK